MTVANLVPALPAAYQMPVWNGTAFEWDSQTGGVDICAEFGVSTTATDNGPAINTALSTLGPLGLDAVITKPGVYPVQTPLVIGNGSATALATWSARLRGVGNPNWQVAGTSLPPSPVSTALKWTGAANTTMMTVKGPLSGWGLENLLFDGNSGSAAYGIQLLGAQWGQVRNVAFQGSQNGISSLTQSANVGSNVCNTMHNHWQNIRLTWTGKAGGGNIWGWLFHSGAASGLNTCYEQIDNLTVVIPSTSLGGMTSNAIAFAFCDNIKISRVHFFGGVTGTDTKYWLYYLNEDTNFPSDCVIEHVDFGSASAVIHVGSNFPQKNRILDISMNNGTPADPLIANLMWGYQNAQDGSVKGTATLVSGTVAVSDTTVTANSRIVLKMLTPGGTVGAHFVSARTAGSGFTITSTSSTDTSVIAWEHTEE